MSLNVALDACPLDLEVADEAVEFNLADHDELRVQVELSEGSWGAAEVVVELRMAGEAWVDSGLGALRGVGITPVIDVRTWVRARVRVSAEYSGAGTALVTFLGKSIAAAQRVEIYIPLIALASEQAF